MYEQLNVGFGVEIAKAGSQEIKFVKLAECIPKVHL